MKYIRTKDKIYEYTSPSKAFDGVYTTTMGVNHIILYNEIVNQADTILELCDGIIVEQKDEPNNWFIMERQEFANEEEHLKNWSYRAFIKTDNGLIYVAQMNENGVLELL